MNKCDHIKKQLLDLDVSMTIQDSALEQHLYQCSECTAYYQDLMALQQQVDQLPEYDVSDEVFAKTLAAVQQETQQPRPGTKRRINPQWATGLAASFVLVAVAGLLYNGSISNFQGDFSEVALESSTDMPGKNKDFVSPEPTPVEEEAIVVDFVDLEEVVVERQRRVQQMARSVQPNQPTIDNTLNQLQENELTALEAAPVTADDVNLETPAPMPDLLRDSIDEALISGEPTLGSYGQQTGQLSELKNRRDKNIEGVLGTTQTTTSDTAGGFSNNQPLTEPVMPVQSEEELASAQDMDRIEVTGSRIKRSEPEPASPVVDADFYAAEPTDEAQIVAAKPKPALKKNEVVASSEKARINSEPPKLDQLLTATSQSATNTNQVNVAEAKEQHKKQDKLKNKAASPEVDGVPSSQPSRQPVGDKDGRLRKDLGVDAEADAVNGDRIMVTGSRLKQSAVEMTEEAGYVDALPEARKHSAAIAYLGTLADTTGLNFKTASGYWANTYLPGDSHMRWFQSYLAQANSLDLPEVRQNQQPFDAPTNAALAMYVSSDRSNLDASGPTRMRVQVGLQAGKQQGGHRSALNLAVVLDLGDQPVQAEVKALLDALLKNKRTSDQVSVFTTGQGGGQVIQATDFRHGPIQVMLGELFEQDDQQTGSLVSLNQSIQAANQWLQTQDDPNAVLGSSAIWLVSANNTALVTSTLEHQVHRQATEGITFSTVAIGSAYQRDPLERLALQGQGHSRVMASVNDAQRVVKAEMMAASRAVARALRLQIRLAEGVQLIDVLGSYSLNEAQAQKVRAAEQSLDQRMAKNLNIKADRGEDEDGIQMVIPSFFAGDTHVVLLDVLVNHIGSQDLPIVEVNAKYKDLIYLRNASSSKNLEMSVGSSQLTPLELNVMKNVLAYRFATTMKVAAGLLNSADHKQAVVELTDLLQLLESLRQHIPAWKEDREIMQDEQVIKQYLNLLNSQSAIDPNQYQLIVVSMNVNSWRRLLTHSP